MEKKMNVKKYLSHFLQKFKILNAITDPDQHIDELKKHLVSLLLVIINFFAIPVVIIGIIEAIILKQQNVAISHFVLFSPILIITLLRNKVSYRTTSVIVIFFIYFIGLYNLVIYGFSGGGIPILLTMMVLTVLFRGIKPGLIAVIICLLSIIIIGYLYIHNILYLAVPLQQISTYPISWITASTLLTLLGVLVVVSVGIIQKKMLYTVQYSIKQAKKLNDLNASLETDIEKRKQVELELRNLKNDLEEKVKEQTKELQEKVDNLQHFYDATIEREKRMEEMRIEIEELKEIINTQDLS